MVNVIFYSLEGKFARVKNEIMLDEAALPAVRAYAEAAGYTNVRIAKDIDDPLGGYRATGTTPGGRSGRNIAQVDPY